jgi:monothiol glutaredoxin
MSRLIVEESRIHPGARAKIHSNHREIVEECQRAVDEHDVVIIGMKQNPVPKRARKILDGRQVAYHYLEFGSYLGPWRRRNALKMWTGWPTFPMIFVKGMFIGGCAELEALLASGEFDRLRTGPRSSDYSNAPVISA